MMDNWVMVNVTIMHETGAAVLVSDGDVEVWLPKSRVGNWGQDWGAGDTVEMEIEEQVAENGGLL